MKQEEQNNLNLPQVIIRGGGDIATATIMRLHRGGFRVLVLETARPTAIRRSVAFSEAVFNGTCEVEGDSATLVHSLSDCVDVWDKGHIPVLVDPQMNCLAECENVILIDAILAKKGGYYKDLPPVTYSIALGPGFVAGRDVDAVIETCRGHNLGRIIYDGAALANTGLPGVIGGFSAERVIYAPKSGILQTKKKIGDVLKRGDVIACIDSQEIHATINGILRGLLPDGFKIREGLKMADIDPREEEIANCYKISEKARCISGGVLEALLVFKNSRSK